MPWLKISPSYILKPLWCGACLGQLNRRKPNDVEELKKIQNKLSDRYNKPRHDKLMKDYVFEISKGNLLLQAHVNRVELSPSLQKVRRVRNKYAIGPWCEATVGLEGFLQIGKSSIATIFELVNAGPRPT